MTSWDAFDSFHRLYSHSQPPPPPPQPQPLPFQPVQSSLRTLSSFSLDRYLKLVSLLCGGIPSATTTTAATPHLAVRPLGPFESTAVKVDDLKALLALHGLNPGSKSKQEILNALPGLHCHSPLFLLPPDRWCDANVSSGRDSTAVLIHTMKSAIEHCLHQQLQQNKSKSKNNIHTALASTGFYSYCPLPQYSFDTTPVNAKPTSSETTCASSQIDHPPCQHIIDDDDVCMLQPDREWLLPGLKFLSTTCKGTGSLNIHSTAVQSISHSLVGRKVALVITDDITVEEWVVERGLVVAHVVGCIGNVHDAHACLLGCTDVHSFYNVRIAPTRGKDDESEQHRSAGRPRGRQWIEVEVDLREEFRLDGLDDVLYCDEKKVSDAWVLVEPLDG